MGDNEILNGLHEYRMHNCIVGLGRNHQQRVQPLQHRRLLIQLDQDRPILLGQVINLLGKQQLRQQLIQSIKKTTNK